MTENVVDPPITDTGRVTAAVRTELESRAALIHIATPEAVAEVIAHLCTNAARLVTANVIHLRWPKVKPQSATS